MTKASVTLVVVTHFHIDHVGMAMALQMPPSLDMTSISFELAKTPSTTQKQHLFLWGNSKYICTDLGGASGRCPGTFHPNHLGIAESRDNFAGLISYDGFFSTNCSSLISATPPPF
jgi:hypothetical protein